MCDDNWFWDAQKVIFIQKLIENLKVNHCIFENWFESKAFIPNHIFIFTSLRRSLHHFAIKSKNHYWMNTRIWISVQSSRYDVNFSVGTVGDISFSIGIILNKTFIWPCVQLLVFYLLAVAFSSDRDYWFFDFEIVIVFCTNTAHVCRLEVTHIQKLNRLFKTILLNNNKNIWSICI